MPINTTIHRTAKQSAMALLLLAAAFPFSAPLRAEVTAGEILEVQQTPHEVRREVSGTVIDDKTKEKLMGVNVAIYSNGKLITGMPTHTDGSFSLKAPAGNYSIRFSYIGYETKELQSKDMKRFSGIVVHLSANDNALSESVATGFFTRKKSSFTGSVTQLKGEDLKMVSGTNIMTAISALTPGMELVQNTAAGSNPNHVPELVLRGMSSFSNQGQEVNQPTIILDGTEISMQELYDLDMNEIESINVLKDASATALYGSKAANGVIVITRKPIKESQLRIAYNFTGNVQFPRLGDYNVLNAKDKLEYERLAGLYEAKNNPSNTTYDPETGLPWQYTWDNIYNERYKAVMAGQNSDWLSQPARNSFSHDHSLRIYGGASNLRYELTGRFADTRGVMKGDYRKRYSLGFKLDYFINNKIQISNRSNYQEVKTQESPYGSFSQYVLMNPYDRMYNPDGSANINLAWDAINPLYDAQLGSFDRSGTRTFTNSTDLRWDINKLFRISGHFDLSTSAEADDAYTSPKAQYFLQNEPDLSKRGSYVKGSGQAVSYNGNLLAAFNKLYRDESLISVTGGWEINHSERSNSVFEAIGFFNDKNSFISNAVGYPNTKPSGSQTESADVGFFITGALSWRNRYFVDGTWRTTGSSLFGANNRFGRFWSAGAGWSILNGPFMQPLKRHFDLFKLRGSAGYTGKVTFQPFDAISMYQYQAEYEYKNGLGAVLKAIGNPNLTWERTMNYNVGLDFSMFQRRLNFVIDAYVRNTTDLLLNKSVAPSTGATSAMANLGEMQNKGIEFQLDGYIFRTRTFNWKIGTTGYMNRNKITKINKALEEQNKENLDNQKPYGDPLPQYAEGESVTALKLVRSAGIDPATGKEIYIKRNGEYTFDYDPADKVLIGDKEPRYTGTFNTNLYWKGFSLYAMFNFRVGAWTYNMTRAMKVEGADPRQNADQRVFDQRWKNPGDIAFYKDIADRSLVGSTRQTDRFAEKENTLTFSTLNLSYEFNEKICKKLLVRNLRCGVNVTDLFRLSTVKRELGTDYLYSKGFEMFVNVTF